MSIRMIQQHNANISKKKHTEGTDHLKKMKAVNPYLERIEELVTTSSHLFTFLIRNERRAGEGFSVNTRTTPAGNDIITFPVVYTTQLYEREKNKW